MPISEKLLKEFDDEMATTRRVIARIPTDKGEWKPHVKSFALGHFTQLVATMPGWITRTLREPEMNVADEPAYSFQTTESLLDQFDRHSAEAHDALARTTDADLEETWSLKMGEQTL